MNGSRIIGDRFRSFLRSRSLPSHCRFSFSLKFSSRSFDFIYASRSVCSPRNGFRTRERAESAVAEHPMNWLKGKCAWETWMQTIDNGGVPAANGICHDSESFSWLRRHLEQLESGEAPVELRSVPSPRFRLTTLHTDWMSNLAFREGSFSSRPTPLLQRLTVFSNSTSPPSPPHSFHLFQPSQRWASWPSGLESRAAPVVLLGRGRHRWPSRKILAIASRRDELAVGFLNEMFELLLVVTFHYFAGAISIWPLPLSAPTED